MLFGIHGIEESSTYQAILAQGREKGRAEGQAEGKAEGKAEEAKHLLMRLGHKRFGPPTPQVIATIEALSDVERIERMVDRSLEASSWDEVLDVP